MIQLSDAYNHMTMWALVYHVQPGSTIVELITNRFFKSKKKAAKWLKRKTRDGQYVEPEAVEVSHFNRLVLTSDRFILPEEDLHE